MPKTRAWSISLMLFPHVKAFPRWQVLEAPSQRCSTRAQVRAPDTQRMLGARK